MATSADTTPKKEAKDGVAENDSDATVDYNPAPDADANANANADNQDDSQRCYGCGDDAHWGNEGHPSDSIDYSISDEVEWRNLRRRHVGGRTPAQHRRRRRRNALRNFMRGYDRRSPVASSGTDQSEPLDGSDRNGRRVRPRINGIFRRVSANSDDSIFISSEDNGEIILDTGKQNYNLICILSFRIKCRIHSVSITKSF